MINNSIGQLFVKFYKPRLFITGIIFLTITLLALLSAFIPWYSTKLITIIQESSFSDETWSRILYLFAFVSVLLLLSIILNSLFEYLVQNRISQPGKIILRKEYVNDVLHKDNDFWNRTSAGDAWSKINTITESICSSFFLIDFLTNVYKRGLSLIIMIYLIIQIHCYLGIFFLFGSIFLLTVCYLFSANTAQSSAQQENFINKTFGEVINTISNYFLVKIFGMVNNEAHRLNKFFDASAKGMQKNSYLHCKNHLYLTLFLVAFECLAIIYAIILWAHGKINIGNVIFVISTARGMTDNLNSMIFSIMYLRSTFFKTKNNIKLLNVQDAVTDIPNAPELKITNGQIEFKNLTFAYAHKINVLENINLTVKAKEKVGIVGMSGSGKSTLLNLLQRILATPENAIFIDGQDITKISQESLHEALAYIPQDTSLFHRSILENLQYGDFNSSNEQVMKIAQDAYVSEFIEDLPDKYETLVGDKGIKLSGGQRQRVGIARAFLKDSPILLLDEATAALDSLSEKYIQKSLRNLIKNKTVLIVAHRLSTLKNMDRIIVLDKGQIVEEGTPAELLKNDGQFAELWNLQA